MIATFPAFSGVFLRPVRSLIVAMTGVAAVVFIAPLQAANEEWDGDTDGVWATPSNWVGDTGVPGTGDDATFNSAVGLGMASTIDLGAGVTIEHLIFSTSNVAAYTIGLDTQTLTIDGSGGNSDGILMTGTVANDQTIDADIVLGDDAESDRYSFRNLSAANTLIINGDITTGSGGPGLTAEIANLDLGSFSEATGPIVLNGNFSLGGASRFQMNVVNSNVTLNGAFDPIAGANTMRTFVRDGGTLTISSTGVAAEGNFEVYHGTANFNNSGAVQLLDGILRLGHTTDANGDATVNIGAGVTIEMDGDIDYVADDDTFNKGRVSGGVIDLSDTSRTYEIQANANNVSGEAEMEFATTFKGSGDTNGTAEDLAFTGDGTLLWNSSIDKTIAGEKVDLVRFENKKTIVGSSGTDWTGLRRSFRVSQRNNLVFSDFDLELDINGQTVLLDDDFVLGAYNNANVATPSFIYIKDSADSDSSYFRLTGDNDLQTFNGNNASGGVGTNRTIFFEADIVFEGGTMTIDVEDGADDVDLEISGTITDDTNGGRSVVKSDLGTLRLTATNNVYNDLLIYQGTAQITNAGALGDNDLQVGNNDDNGTFEYIGSGDFIKNQLRIGDNDTGTGAGTILANGTGAVVFTNVSANEARGTGGATPRTLFLGGANTDDNTIQGALIDNGAGTVAITKQDAGKWILDGDNTYTGATQIDAGLLEINGSNVSSFTVGTGSGSGANIGGSGSTSGNITFAEATHSLSVDGLAGGLETSGTLDLDDVDAGGIAVTITNAGTGAFNIISYGAAAGFTAGSGNAKFTVVSAPTGSARIGGGAGTLSDTGSAITFDLGYEEKIWEGTDGTNPTYWDINTTANWSGGTDALFFDGDSVIFNDTATDFNPTLQSSVTVGNMTISPQVDTNDYVISGENGTEILTVDGVLTVAHGGASNSNSGVDITISTIIAGDGSLFVGNGDGVTDSSQNSLVISAANTFTGGTRIAEGRVSLSSSSATLGTGLITLDESTGNNRDPLLDFDANGITLNNDIFVGDTGNKIIRIDNGGDGATAHTATLAGNIVNTENNDTGFRLDVGANDTLIVTGKISGTNVQTRATRQAADGTVILSNAGNDFVGTLGVGSNVEVASIGNAGVASHAGAGNLITLGLNANSSPTSNNNQEGNLIYTGTGDSTDKQVQVGNFWFGTGHIDPGIGGTITNNGTGSLNFTNSQFSVQESRVNRNEIGARTLTLAGTFTGTNTISGTILDNGTTDAMGFDDETVSIDVNTAGIWQLDGDNEYTGTTTVTSGTLLLNGDNSAATGDVTVTEGGTLGGTGTIGGDISVEGSNTGGVSGGVLSAGLAGAPGAGTVDDIGSLDIDGALSATVGTEGSATWLVDINNAVSGSSDVIVLGATNSPVIDLTNFQIVLNDFGTFTLGNTYDIVTYTNPTFGSAFSNAADQTEIVGLGGGKFLIDYDHDLGGGNYSIQLTAVPEPSTLLLLLPLLAIGFWSLRRRQAMQKSACASRVNC